MYEEIESLIRKRYFREARAKISQIGISVDRDARSPSQLLTANSNVSKLTFICGLHRSGTTLLNDLIAKSYDFAFIEKAKVPEDEGQFLQDVYPSERPFGGPGMFAFYPQMRPEPILDRSVADTLARRFLNTWSAYSNDSGYFHLLEKSPPNITRIKYLRSIFPMARFIIVTRDPRAVSMSTRKWHRIPIHALMQHWNTAYMHAIEALDDDCMVISYEDFCLQPEVLVAAVADFCGMERRKTPLNPKQRFEEIRNSNAKYLTGFPKEFKFRAKVKAWEILGYHF